LESIKSVALRWSVKVGDLVKARSRPWYGIITDTLRLTAAHRVMHVVWTDSGAFREDRVAWFPCRELEVLSASR